MSFIAEELVQEVRLVAGVDSGAESEEIGSEVAKAVGASLFPFAYQG